MESTNNISEGAITKFDNKQSNEESFIINDVSNNNKWDDSTNLKEKSIDESKLDNNHNNNSTSNKYVPVLSKRKQVRQEMEQRKKWNTPRITEKKNLNKAENNLSTNQNQDNENANDEKIPKKFYGLMFGYCGINYQGLQINPNSNTIEKTVEEAIFKAGGLIPTNRDFSRNHWTRACRTDKGVHAAANIVSLKMNVMENIEDKINAQLPDDIKIFKCIRVTKSFSGYRFCSERRYEYIIPSYCFQNIFKSFALSQILSDELKNELLNSDIIPIAVINQIKSYNSDYKISPANKIKLDRLLGQYLGTHSFHNFTIRRAFTDPSNSRYLKEVRAVEYFDYEGIEFIRILIKGQSFMLHQIRKMIGFIVCIMRGIFEESCFNKVYNRDCALLVPMSPACGLFLDRCYFDGYNNKVRSTKDAEHLEEIDWDKIEDEVESFKRAKIHPCMLKASHDGKEFTTWLSNHVDKPQWWSEVHNGKLNPVEIIEDDNIEDENL